MKKKLIGLIMAIVCTIACVFALVACGKEINYLRADDGNGQLKSELEFGIFSVDELDAVKNKFSQLTFYYEYYPDHSTAKADMSKVKLKHFVNGEGKEGLPEVLQSNGYYTVYYYYEGHEPTADFSDSFAVRISFSVE